MSKVLLTGSAGAIGSVLQSNVKAEWVAFDLPEHDARDYSALRKQMPGCDAIIHLAWDTERDNYKSGYTNPANLAMAQNIYRGAAGLGIPRVIMASSIHADMPMREPDGLRSPYRLPEPDSPYGATKVAVETLGRYYATRHAVEVVCIRFGWVSPHAGDRPDPAKPYPPGEGWISHKDCSSLIAACLTARTIPNNYQILWGLSRRVNGGKHDLNNSLWHPQDSYNAPL